MGTCLVTKLKESVDDSSLERIGELRFTMGVDEIPSSGNRLITLASDVVQTVSIIDGNAYFTDSTFTQNYGQVTELSAGTLTALYISNEECVISIANKYELTNFFIRSDGETSTVHSTAKFDISNLEGCTKLTVCYLPNSNVYGDIAVFDSCPNLQRLSLRYDSEIFGNLNAFTNLTQLQSVDLRDVPLITGDIASFANTANAITYVMISSSNVTGDISVFENSRAVQLIMNGTSVYGDLSKMPSTLNGFFKSAADVGTFTWTSTRSDASFIMTIATTLNLGTYVDAMLINQANCVAAPLSNKRISVKGTRTSASDAAIQTLESKGYTVTIVAA